MAATPRNPLIDRYYSPLGTPLDFDQSEVDEARTLAIENVRKQLSSAIANQNLQLKKQLQSTLIQLGADPQTTT
jgi:hypothetical protein